MDNRERILQAAAHVYSQHGFRGATTRLIANEAGVNEVTLFRLFGSKSQLFDALLQAQLAGPAVLGTLPELPADPERELTDFIAALLVHMRGSASLLRKMIGEMEERPDAAITACNGPQCAGQLLGRYVAALRERGLATVDEGEERTAISMLMGALFGDAMCRELMPDGFPQPVEEAPRQYVRSFLRSIGAPVHAAGASRRPTAAPSRQAS